MTIQFNPGGQDGDGYRNAYYYNVETGEVLPNDEATVNAYRQQETAEDTRVKTLLSDPNVSWWDKVQSLEKRWGIGAVASAIDQGFFSGIGSNDSDSLGRYVASRQAEGDRELFGSDFLADFMPYVPAIAMGAAGLMGGAAGVAGAGAAETGLSLELAAGAPELAGTMGLGAGGTAAGAGTGLSTEMAMNAGMPGSVGADLGSMSQGVTGGAGGTLGGGLSGTGTATAAGAAGVAASGMDFGGTGVEANNPIISDYNGPSGFPTNPMTGSPYGGLPWNNAGGLAPTNQGMNWLGLGSDVMGFLGQREYQQDLMNTMNRAIDYSDPAYAQRGQYQQQYSNMNTNPNWMETDQVMSGLREQAVRSKAAQMSAKGYFGSGNMPHELYQTGINATAPYALQRMQQVGEAGGLLGGRQNAGQAIASLGQASGQAGLGSIQSLQSGLGRLPTAWQNSANNAISGGLNNLFNWGL